MNDVIIYAATAAVSYLVARVLASALGLDQLAEDMGRWFRATVPWLTYGGGQGV